MGVFKGTEFYEWAFEYELPADFSVKSPTVQKQYHLQSSHPGKCYSVQYAFDEILISYSRIYSDQPIRLQREIKGECVEMIFILQGKSIFTINREALHAVTGNQHNMYYGYGCDEEIEINTADGPAEILVIHLSKSYYFRLLHQKGNHQQSFFDRVMHHQHGFLSSTNFAIIPAMKLAIDEIRHCRKTSSVKRIFLEAKVLELLVLQTEQIEQEKKLASVHGLHYNELSRLTEAKRIVEKNVSKPPTIGGLSKLIGMNESDLKRGFKKIFGITIFGYVSQLKMQRAKYLLSVKNKSVSETAYLVGYKNPQHFTAAFKRYYRMVPSQLKREKFS